MPVTDQRPVYSFLPNNTAIGMSAWSLREAGLHHSVKSLHYITAVAVESHFMNTVLTVPDPQLSPIAMKRGCQRRLSQAVEPQQ